LAKNVRRCTKRGRKGAFKKTVNMVGGGVENEVARGVLLRFGEQEETEGDFLDGPTESVLRRGRAE